MSEGEVAEVVTGEDELEVRLKAYEGRAAAVAGAGKDPVNMPMIRHWCEAMGDTNPAYAGPDAMAPPTMLQAWTMGGLSGHEGRTGATTNCSACSTRRAAPRLSPPTASRSTCDHCAPGTRSPSTR